eukprot:CAMPEP_0114318950 /NCGR_PEP_ID=MMETSP0059-20121206/24962_1 /TAXON_ID=36894 /ORGANISM="Pyramimonas parkeae, Strain CCMP726" /LENGTH=55 /DNA_ID=CAMNT_0001445887 /DNA_START=440 /DNA_END=607 /DNA_ORIENTATION=-
MKLGDCCTTYGHALQPSTVDQRPSRGCTLNLRVAEDTSCCAVLERLGLTSPAKQL